MVNKTPEYNICLIHFAASNKLREKKEEKLIKAAAHQVLKLSTLKGSDHYLNNKLYNSTKTSQSS